MKKLMIIPLVCVLIIATAKVCNANATIEDTSIKEEYIGYVEEICGQYGICSELVISIIERESSGKADAVSPHGAIGLMQIIPKYQQDRMARLGVDDLYNPYDNILVGVDYLSELFNEYEEPYEVLMFYNQGYEGLKKAQNLEFSKYATGIIKRSQELERFNANYAY